MSRPINKFIFCIVIFLCGSFGMGASATNQFSVEALKVALTKYINYEICWGGDGPTGITPYRLGKAATLSLSVDEHNKEFYVWGNNLQYVAGKNQPEITDHYYGVYSGSDVVVIGMGGPASKSKKSLSNRKNSFSLVIPSQCKMDFPASPRKQAMVNGIVKSFKDFFIDSAPAYPSTVHIVIANFDIYYPYTLVYIVETHELYSLTLHDVTNYFGSSFLMNGYPFNLVNYFDKSSSVVKKIMTYGIYRTIKLPPGKSNGQVD